MAQKVISVDVRLAVAVARRVQGESVNVSAVCAELGISRPWFYELERRFQREGLEGVLAPRSRAPRDSKHQTSAAVEDLIVLLRKEIAEEGWDCGPLSILDRLPERMAADPALAGLKVPSRATVHRVLQRRGQIVPDPSKRPAPPLRRFEYGAPNACWQIDATEWFLADGSKVHIVEVLDDHSRKLLSHHVARTENEISVWAALMRAMDRHGLPAKVLSDRGSAMLGQPQRFSQIRTNLNALGITCATSRGNRPQTCGKNERVHRTLHQWLNARPAAQSMAELELLLIEYEDRYNQRKHQALGKLTPDQRYTALPKIGPSGVINPDPLVVTENHVNSNGVVSLAGGGQGHLGREWSGCKVIVLRRGLQAAVFHKQKLVTSFSIDPTKLYQSSGKTNDTSRQQKRPRIKDQEC